MLYSIWACVGAIFWAVCLLIAFTLMFAMFFEEVAYWHLDHQSPKPETVMVLKKYWNGMFASFLTLISSVTGGVSWEVPAEPFFSMGVYGDFFGMVFMTFILWTLLGMINIVVAVFVKRTEDLSSVSRDFALASATGIAIKNEKQIEDLFDELDKDKTGAICLTGIKEGLKHKRIQAYFHHLGIDIMRPDLMVNFFDEDHDGTLDRKEFVEGCKRLQGGAKPAEIAEILVLIKGIEGKLLLNGRKEHPSGSSSENGRDRAPRRSWTTP
jgi:hypothetical protein